METLGLYVTVSTEKGHDGMSGEYREGGNCRQREEL